MNALWWYNRTGEEKYKVAADGIRGMLERHPRTPSGGVSSFLRPFSHFIAMELPSPRTVSVAITRHFVVVLTPDPPIQLPKYELS